MAVVRKQGNTHLREASFSSYLDLQTIPPRQTSHSHSSSYSPASRTARSESASSPVRRFRRSQSHRSPLGELMAFRAGRYFREAVEDDDDCYHSTVGGRGGGDHHHPKSDARTEANNNNSYNNKSTKQRKKKNKKNRELVCCSSWNSQISSSMLLLQYPSRKNPETSTTSNKSRNLLSSGLKFFSGLRCKGSCSDIIIKPPALGPANPPLKDPASIVVVSSKQPNATTAAAADTEGFVFPVAVGARKMVGGSSEKGVGERREVRNGVVEMSNDASEEDDDDEIEIDLERRVMRRRRMGRDGWVEEDHDDEVDSNGSSDLFEIQAVPDRFMTVSPATTGHRKQDDV